GRPAATVQAGHRKHKEWQRRKQAAIRHKLLAVAFTRHSRDLDLALFASRIWLGDTVTGTLKVDPTKTPKEIDATDSEGKTIRGIYKFEKGQFTVCFAPPDQE